MLRQPVSARKPQHNHQRHQRPAEAGVAGHVHIDAIEHKAHRDHPDDIALLIPHRRFAAHGRTQRAGGFGNIRLAIDKRLVVIAAHHGLADTLGHRVGVADRLGITHHHVARAGLLTHSFGKGLNNGGGVRRGKSVYNLRHPGHGFGHSQCPLAHLVGDDLGFAVVQIGALGQQHTRQQQPHQHHDLQAKTAFVPTALGAGTAPAL